MNCRIGRASALRLAAEGAELALGDLNLDGVHAVALEISAAGGQATAMEFDAADAASCRHLVDRAVAVLGRLDIVANIAGMLQRSLFEDISPGTWDRVIAVNLTAHFHIIQQALPHLTETRGNIVNMASSAGIRGVAMSAAYSASKHGLIGLIRSAAEPLAEKGIRINAILPGGVNTPLNFGEMVDTYVPPDELKMPAYRGYGESQHIAEFALYLASPRASFINGGAHVIDGGLTASFAAVRYEKAD